MSVEKPEDLSKYSNATSSNDIVTIGNYSYKDENGNDVQGLSFDQIYTNLTSKGNDVHYHKSLDFSNVGMPNNNSDQTDNTKRLRQFHQTRLYIMDYDGVMAHNQKQEKRNSTYLISSNLPEQFSYSVGSNWSQPFQQFSSATLNGLIQLGGRDVINGVTGTDIGDNFQSLTNRFMTIMAWNGSMPLSLKLRIPVIDDGHPDDSTTGVGLRTNLAEALEYLGSLCLPKRAGNLGFYQPPPSPYDFSYTTYDYTKNKDGTTTINGVNKDGFNVSGKANNHARIMLQLGGMLLVDNIIIKSISVDYPNTKTMIRHWYSPYTQVGAAGKSYLTPLLAYVNIDLTTSEAMTAETYSNMLWLKQQQDQGSFSYSNVEMDQMLGTTGSALGNMIKGGLNAIKNAWNKEENA